MQAGYCLGAWISYDSLLDYICQSENANPLTDASSYLLTDFAGNVLTSQANIKSVSKESLGQTIKSKDQVTLSCQVLHPGIYIVRMLRASEFSLPNHWYSLQFPCRCSSRPAADLMCDFWYFPLGAHTGKRTYTGNRTDCSR